MSEQSRPRISQDSGLNGGKNGDTFSLFSFALQSPEFVFNGAHLIYILGEIVNITKTLKRSVFLYRNIK